MPTVWCADCGKRFTIDEEPYLLLMAFIQKPGPAYRDAEAQNFKGLPCKRCAADRRVE